MPYPGPDGARMIFGAIIGAGIVAMLIAPLSAGCCVFPPLVTGTIILIDRRHADAGGHQLDLRQSWWGRPRRSWSIRSRG